MEILQWKILVEKFWWKFFVKILLVETVGEFFWWKILVNFFGGNAILGLYGLKRHTQWRK